MRIATGRVTAMFGYEWNLFRYFFGRGPGGPVLFLWTVGMGLFLFVFQLPTFALVWTCAAVVLVVLALLTFRRDPNVWREMIRSSIGERFPRHPFADQSLRATVQKSTDVWIEVALKVRSSRKTGRPWAELDRIPKAAFELLSLQYELALKQAELVSGLALIVPDDDDAVVVGPRNENVEATQNEVAEVGALVVEIGQRLETLMLRVLQLENSPDIVGGATDLADEVEGAVAGARERAASLHQVAHPLVDIRVPLGLERLMLRLGDGFSRVKSSEGVRALGQLAHEYTELQVVLERRTETDSLSVAQLPRLAETTYRQGLGVLEDSLDLLETISSSDQKRLETEVNELKTQIGDLRKEGGPEARLRIKEKTLSSHGERLSMVERQHSHVEALLHQCSRCEASLHLTRIRLAELRAESAETDISTVAETLRKTIDQAKEVQAEMSRLGY